MIELTTTTNYLTLSEIGDVVAIELLETSNKLELIVSNAGLKGDEGRHIESVSFINDDMVFVNDDSTEVVLIGAKIDLKGETGSQGIQGVQGLKGDIGLTGDKGDKGDTGGQGLQGIQGIQGIQGETGPQGIQGIKGDTGLQGIKGDTGDTGAQGIKGDKGDKGETGDTGLQGIQGVQGLKGDKGDKGDTGEVNVRSLSTTIDFLTIPGENQYIEKTITDALILSTSTIIIDIVSYVYRSQNVQCGIKEINNGVSYTIYAVAPDGATGEMSINIKIF